MSRRDFVATCAVSATGVATSLPAPLQALDSRTRRWLLPFYTADGGTLRDSRVRGLVNLALNASREVGAQYADVQVTYTRYRTITHEHGGAGDGISIEFGVRALIDGNWGVAATPVLSEAEIVRVGRAAALNAKLLGKHGRVRDVEWVPIPTVHDGDWTTPIDVDPFTVPPKEVAAFLNGEVQFAQLRPGLSWGTPPNLYVHFRGQDRVFASTEGSYGIQTFYFTTCEATLVSNKGGAAPLRSAGTAQAGWEHVRDQPWRTAIPSLVAEIEENLKLPIEDPLDVGRYDIVFGAEAMASLLATTVGSATSIGRALGYEADGLGTSYLGPNVFAVLGTPIASPLLSMTANRSRPKAMATVKWDDEGVTPEDFPLISRGILNDFLTTREQAPWLKEWYAKQGVPIRSRGCATIRNARSFIRENTPNLAMTPGAQEKSFDDLIADIGTGVAIPSLNWVRMDWQCLNGLTGIGGYRVHGGKRVARLVGSQRGSNALMFRAPEFLKGISAIGGARSVWWSNVVGDNNHNFSIGAVPAVVKQMTVIDPSRRG